MSFHKGIEQAILLCKDAVIDYKLTELTDNVNRLAAQRRVSAGKFFCDLLLQVALSPVLGTIVGHLATRPLDAIARVRSGLVEMEGMVANFAKRTAKVNEDSLDAFAEAVLKKVVKDPARKREVAAKLGTGLSDVHTGIVVDSFQKINEGLFNLWSAPSEEVNKLEGYVPFDRDVSRQIPTNLEMITNNANNYIKYQTEANASARSILEWLLARTKKRDALQAFQKFLDFIAKEFSESSKNSVAWEREIKNLSKMVGVLLYWGDPDKWGKPQKNVRTVRQKTEMDVYTSYAFDPTWPPALIQQVLTNILFPGSNETFLDYFTGLKRRALGRDKGPGINGRRTHSEIDESFGLGPPRGTIAPLEIRNPKSEYFTAQDLAFFAFQQYMKGIYNQLNSGEYDTFFQNLLRERSLLPP
jgi:hypothetical protein